MQKLSKIGIFSIMVAASLTIMVGSAITPALIKISHHYGVEDMASWLVTLPALGVVLFAPFAGQLIDRTGAYVTLCAGLVLYGFFGIVAIWISEKVLLFADRLLLGAATALVMSAATALIADFFNGDERLKMIAVQGMSIEIGGIIFLSIGGIVGEISWKGPFTIYLLAWVALLLIIFTVPFHKRRPVPQVQELTDETSETIFPILLSAFLSMMLFFIAIISLPLYLASNFHFTSAETGYFLAFISFVAVLGASIMPKVVKRTSDYQTFMFGFLLYTIGHLILSVTQGLFALVFVAGIFIGIGFAFTIPLANHMTVEKASVKTRGKKLAYLSSLTFLGQFISSFTEGIFHNPNKVFMFTALMSAFITSVAYIGLKHERKKNFISIKKS